MSKKEDKIKIPEHILNLIRVTPEMTEEARSKLKYTITPKPEGAKNPKGKLWCCYCGDFKKFKNKRDAWSSYPRCETCNISTEDFHIKTANKLWGDAVEKRKKD